MADPRIENLARVMVEYSNEVRPGHTVVISSLPFSPPALPYLLESARAVLRAGGHPMFDLDPEGYEPMLIKEGSEDQLDFLDPRMLLLAREADRAIMFNCEENTRRMSGLDAERQARRMRAWKEYQEIINRRNAEGDFHWVLTLVPTTGYAQDAEMDLETFEDFFFRTVFADQEDPVAPWIAMRSRQLELVERLCGRRLVEVKGPHVDLRLSIEGRPFISCHGDENIPDGEIFTAPVEDSVQGWIRFSYPGIFLGREVTGVELRFEDGKVVQAQAEKNEDYLHAMLETDAGARYVGEFAIGTNERIDRFTRNILFDEKIGGTMHMALGFGFLESGSKNKSSLHWDLITDMKEGGEIRVDGDLFYDSGEFKV
ncbi:MAG: aminopeptidase [Anaerolineales bacterium]